MWTAKKNITMNCEATQDALERETTGPASEGVVALGTLLVRLPDSVREHVNSCSDCRVFADELLEVRGMFIGSLKGPEPGPFFLQRVMASIASRELEFERKTQTWAAVPRLAYRLSVLASLTLLIAGSWLYERPTQPTSVAGMSAEQSPEGLIEGGNPVVQDDFLLNTADK